MKRSLGESEEMSDRTKLFLVGGIVAAIGIGMFAILSAILIVKYSGSKNDEVKKPTPTSAAWNYYPQATSRIPSRYPVVIEAMEKQDDPSAPDLTKENLELKIETSIPSEREGNFNVSPGNPTVTPGRTLKLLIGGSQATYRLIKAPIGMTVSKDGWLIWDVPKEFKGSTEVLVEIMSTNGKTQQTITFEAGK